MKSWLIIAELWQYTLLKLKAIIGCLKISKKKCQKESKRNVIYVRKYNFETKLQSWVANFEKNNRAEVSCG